MLPYVPNTAHFQTDTGQTWNISPFLRNQRYRGRTMADRDLTQSVYVFGNPRMQPTGNRTWMSESMRTPGGYQIYMPQTTEDYINRQEEKKSHAKGDLVHSIEMASSKYKNNIRNPETKKKQVDRHVDGMKRRQYVESVMMSSRRVESMCAESVARKKEHDFQCSCNDYHSHPLVSYGTPINKDIAEQARKRERMITMAESTSSRLDNHDDPRNIFWSPKLSFSSYKHGDPLLDFSSLWPKDFELKNHLKNSGIQMTILRVAILDLCKLAITCGPVRLLQCLIDLSLIRVDQQFENGSGMLHLACLSRNNDAVQYLINTGISPKLRDKNGLTADEVCYCPTVKRQLPQRYQVARSDFASNGGRIRMNPSLQDKDNIFNLAKNPKFFDEIQKKLQTFDFNVNTECDSNGDFLLHIACKGGLSQLPLVMALVKIQGADVELCNANGLTSLMLAAAAGNCVLCDVLICLFGSNPNKTNPTGKSALHYAAEGNHRKTVDCLIRRGADVNIEDHDGRRPDDIPVCFGVQDDCREVINFNRMKRLESLSEKVRKGDVEASMLLPTDLFVVDDEGYTLMMIAVIFKSGNALTRLLEKNNSTINAQHTGTGMTSLAYAAQIGKVDAVEILLKNGANPSISDMESYLPLHHAVLNNQEGVVNSFLNFFPDTYLGLHTALRLTKMSSIYHKIKSAWERRQEEIVMPKLIQCAMNGKADDLYNILDEGDSINLKSGSGNWPLYLAVESGHLDVVKLLFEKGGDIRKRHSSTGATVLHRAARHGHYNIVEFLIQFCRTSGVCSRPSRKLLDINAVDAENKTALQLAAERGYIKVAQLLIQHGASTAILDSQGSLFTCPGYEGVRILIETHRDRQTKVIMKLVPDKSKKAFALLQKSWLPRFDHNLRNKQGDTPLMVACRAGRLQNIKFLLESAVYPELMEEEDLDDSDADSGVLDPTRGSQRPRTPRYFEENDDVFQASGNFSQSLEAPGNSLTTSMDLPSPDSKSRSKIRIDGTLQALLRDVNRPKGLFVCQEGYISHVSAVSLMDGCTALHRTIEGGDVVQIVKALLDADRYCLNSQNDAGLSPLHLACSLGRKKTIDHLLSYDEIDLNSRTLDGHLPEELTSTKSVIKMVQKARLTQTGQLQAPCMPEPDTPETFKPPSTIGTTVNFDNLQTRYDEIKQEVRSKVKS